MCIRDRANGIAYVESAMAAGLDVNQFGQRLSFFFAAHNDFCLLYTSDAADERSSVDLGGRRIIKKKKQ